RSTTCTSAQWGKHREHPRGGLPPRGAVRLAGDQAALHPPRTGRPAGVNGAPLAMRQEVDSIHRIVYDLSDTFNSPIVGGGRPDLEGSRHKADERLKDLARVVHKLHHFGLPTPCSQVNPAEWRYDFGVVLQDLQESCQNHVTETARLAAEIPALR